MRRPRTILALVVSLAFALLAASLFAPPAAAANVEIKLWGSTADGWGRTNTSLSIPGPELSATVGDNVTMVLNSTDGRNHNWFIDYNNDSAVDANEPSSPNFRDTEVRWNFTADTNGTFVYRSRFQPDDASMRGNITIQPAGGTTPPPAGSDNTVLIVAGVVVIVIAVLAVAAVFMRRTKAPPPPPQP